MSTHDDDDTGPVTPEEARGALSRFCHSHFKTPGEKAHIEIPANPKRDDDIRLGAFIDQAEEAMRRVAELEAKLAAPDPIDEWLRGLTFSPRNLSASSSRVDLVNVWLGEGQRVVGEGSAATLREATAVAMQQIAEWEAFVRTRGTKAGG